MSKSPQPSSIVRTVLPAGSADFTGLVKRANWAVSVASCSAKMSSVGGSEATVAPAGCENWRPLYRRRVPVSA